MQRLEVAVMKRMICLGIILGIAGLTSSLSPSVSTEHVQIHRTGSVPFAVFDRVFPFRYGNEGGTCFVIDLDGRQYVITARHLVPNIKPGDSVQLYISEKWNTFKITPILPVNGRTDIAALATDRLIAPRLDVLVGSDGAIIGQDTYFLGFPDLPPAPYLTISTVFRGKHFPLVKRAVLSAIDAGSDAGNVLYLDGHNNPGFSGGPVILANQGKEDSVRIIGVVSGYYPQKVRVKEKQVKKTRSRAPRMNADNSPYVSENSGIVISFSMTEIVKAIRSSAAAGLPLPSGNERAKKAD